MKEKKKLSLVMVLLCIVLLVVLVVMYYIYKENMNYNQEIENLETNIAKIKNTTDDLQVQIDSISNTTSSNLEENDVSFIIVSVEDTSSEELEYKMKMVTDEKKIQSLIDIVNSATEYEEESFIADFGDIPPCVEIYLSNGEKYAISAGDNIDDNGNVVNLMTKCYTQDGSDKTLFKVNTELAKYIEELYDSVKSSSLTSEKDIYKRVSIQNIDIDLEDGKDFLVLEDNEIYFSSDLSDRILEGTYKISSNDIIEYNLLEEADTDEFYNTATFQIENNSYKKSIVVSDDSNGKIYYQKVN